MLAVLRAGSADGAKTRRGETPTGAITMLTVGLAAQMVQFLAIGLFTSAVLSSGGLPFVGGAALNGMHLTALALGAVHQAASALRMRANRVGQARVEVVARRAAKTMEARVYRKALRLESVDPSTVDIDVSALVTSFRNQLLNGGTSALGFLWVLAIPVVVLPVLAAIAPVVALVTATGSAAMLLIAHRRSRPLQGIAADQMNADRRLLSVLTQAFDPRGLRDTVEHGDADRFDAALQDSEDRFDEASRKVTRQSNKSAMGLLNAFNGTLLVAIVAATAATSALLTLPASLAAPVLLIVIPIVHAIGETAHSLPLEMEALQRCARTLSEIRRFEQLPEPRGGTRELSDFRSLEISGLGFSHSPHQPMTVHDVDLTVRSGETLLLVGPSGGGKSTLLELCAGHLRPDRGEVSINGHPIASYDRRALRRMVAYVPQESHLPSGLSMEMVVGGGRTLTSQERRIASEITGVDRLVDDWQAPFDPHDYSGGQRQRIAIARAVVKMSRGASLLLLDEGTRELDPIKQTALFRQLVSWTRDEGKTVVVVTHGLSLGPAADRIATVEHGTLTAVGTHNELLSGRTKDGDWIVQVPTWYHCAWKETLGVDRLEPPLLEQITRGSTNRSNTGPVSGEFFP